ncbi:MAG TPA: nicotinate-nucleotide adenylyltransferase [Dongiaceae bacterium]|nr:nicotinate-nucleotide adenylyltransferase [Dongiaceae bacterium]
MSGIPLTPEARKRGLSPFLGRPPVDAWIRGRRRRPCTETADTPARRRGRKVGLLGGSFNPAHEGHRHISRVALKRLGLDEVWWLVSPQNPLKPRAGMAALGKRLREAAAFAGDRRIRVSDFEAKAGLRYTAETLVALRRRFPRLRFVWLMGADNLVQIPAWKDWQRIFNAVPVAVFTRPPYSYRALAAKAARRFASARIDERASRTLPGRAAPAWVFLGGRPSPVSATAIRRRRAGRSETKRTSATTKG